MIEKDIFKKSHVNFDKLTKYGFIKKSSKYIYSKNILDDNFEVIIEINEDGNISSKIIDKEFSEEYINYKNSSGSFANSVKEEYINVLKDIKEKCYTENYFVFSQSNKITKYIIDNYKSNPEFLWDKFPSYGVFRNQNNQKWFAIIMNVKGERFNSKDEIEIINLKLDEKKVKELLSKEGFFKAYHMNSNTWISISLNDVINDEEIIKLVNESYNNINENEEWLIPANPNYFDVINYFKTEKDLIWKQSTDIHSGDIVYIYVGKPYSSIMFKCKVLDTNIPYEYNGNVKMKYIMKLELLKKYRKDEINFEELNAFGIKAIRGPRKISKEITKFF